MGAWIVIRKKARACPGRGFIPWASGGQPRHHITSLLLNVPGLFNHHLPSSPGNRSAKRQSLYLPPW